MSTKATGKKKTPSINIESDVKARFDALQEQTGARNQTELLAALLERFDPQNFFIEGVTKQQRIQLIIEDLLGEFISFTRGGGKGAKAKKESNKALYGAKREPAKLAVMKETGKKEKKVTEGEIDLHIYLNDRGGLYGMKPFYITKRDIDRIANDVYGLRGGKANDKDFVSNPHTFKNTIEKYKKQLNEIYREYNSSEYMELKKDSAAPLLEVRLYKVASSDAQQ